MSLFAHCAGRLIVLQPVHNFAIFAERIDFFRSLLGCYQLLQLVALKPQFIAFIQLEQLPEGFEFFVKYRNSYASTSYRKASISYFS